MFQYITSTVRCNSLSPGSTLHCHNVANVVAAFSRSLVSFFSFRHNLLHRLMYVKYIVQGINGLRVCNSISPMCSCIEFSFRRLFLCVIFNFISYLAVEIAKTHTHFKLTTERRKKNANTFALVLSFRIRTFSALCSTHNLQSHIRPFFHHIIL